VQKIEESVVIARPCAQVFGYLENRTHDQEWMVAVRESHWLDGDQLGAPARVGRRGRMVMEIRGKPVEFLDEVTDYQPGRKVAHRTVEGPFLLHTACLCEPVEGGCRATVVGEAERLVRGPLRWLIEPLVARGVRRSFRSDLARLKQILEQTRRPEGADR